MGLRSPDSNSQEGIRRWLAAVAPATSPEKKASTMATVSGVAQ